MMLAAAYIFGFVTNMAAIMLSINIIDEAIGRSRHLVLQGVILFTLNGFLAGYNLWRAIDIIAHQAS